jgi:hypothetical protein
MKATTALSATLLALTFALVGCDYQVPLTETPTRPVQAQVLGNWVGVGEEDSMLNLRRLDENTYLAIIDNDAYRVFHSDFAGLALVSAQDLNSSERKYCLYTWALQDGTKHLVLRRVSSRVVPEDVPDSATLQQQLQRHLQDPALLGEEIVFRRK